MLCLTVDALGQGGGKPASMAGSFPSAFPKLAKPGLKSQEKAP